MSINRKISPEASGPPVVADSSSEEQALATSQGCAFLFLVALALVAWEPLMKWTCWLVLVAAGERPPTP